VSALTDLTGSVHGRHQHKVTRLACATAEALGFPPDRLEGYAWSLLHDIGKMSVPAEILAKLEPVDSGEVRLIQVHPRAAYDVLRSIDFPWPVATSSSAPRCLDGRDTRRACAATPFYSSRILAGGRRG